MKSAGRSARTPSAMASRRAGLREMSRLSKGETLELLARRCHDEVQECANLRGRQVAGRVKDVKGKKLVVPAREELDQGPRAHEVPVAELHELRDAVAREANAERGRDVVDDEPAVHRDGAHTSL